MSYVVGLTGGIGSGKSAAAEAFAACGAAIVDTDAIAQALTAGGGAALPALRAEFGAAIFAPDGALDRPALRQRVFAEPAARARLEGILHPMIRAEAEAQIRRIASADFPYVVLVVPLLVETGSYRGRVDRVAVVDCPEEMQIARVMARSHLVRTEVETILAAQAARGDRLAIADDLIENDKNIISLRSRVGVLDAFYRAEAAKKTRAIRPKTHD